ncbi:MAG TPA: hypothetical protein VG777_06440 [Thermoanaerobaculia bacterium]|nr:hypothetical protein [Thermoanaerobaculia bacterium]
MRRGIRTGLLVLLLGSAAAEVHAAAASGFTLSVLVGGDPRCEYASRGALYVEALRGVPYALRLTNPSPFRAAVALSVDGLNTIDGRRTDAASARKWVIEPYGSIVIPGWQVSGSAARSFFFTGERGSYGAALGETSNLGVIEAVFFRERLPVPVASAEPSPAAPAVPAGAAEGMSRDSAAPSSRKAASTLSNEFAATGMGGRRDHRVSEVAFDLDPAPAARVRIRYEFRPQLEALGVLPAEDSPLARREGASGFANWCPEPR